MLRYRFQMISDVVFNDCNSVVAVVIMIVVTVSGNGVKMFIPNDAHLSCAALTSLMLTCI